MSHVVGGQGPGHHRPSQLLLLLLLLLLLQVLLLLLLLVLLLQPSTSSAPPSPSPPPRRALHGRGPLEIPRVRDRHLKLEPLLLLLLLLLLVLVPRPPRLVRQATDGASHWAEVRGREGELLHHFLRNLGSVVVGQVEVELDVPELTLHLGAYHQAQHVPGRPACADVAPDADLHRGDGRGGGRGGGLLPLLLLLLLLRAADLEVVQVMVRMMRGVVGAFRGGGGATFAPCCSCAATSSAASTRETSAAASEATAGRRRGRG
jgi:hypothetical protein